MASTSEWIEGARLRTLPAAISPVLAGSAVAAWLEQFDLVRATLCLVVSLALQVGVNYANDYSDGIRGTDEFRVGPQRLVGSGAAKPSTVKAAAFGCFGLAALAGLGLVLLSGQWWLIAVGVACILAAWFYTGGKHPYGYHGLGEVFVFIFFGLVAVLGTCYVQTLQAPIMAWLAAIFVGCVSCAVLVCNNLRDLPNDIKAGKRTLETRLGDKNSRRFFMVLLLIALAMLLVIGFCFKITALFSLVFVPFAVVSALAVRSGTGMALIPPLKWTGMAGLFGSIGLFVGLALV